MVHKNSSSRKPSKINKKSQKNCHRKPTRIFPLKEASERLEDFFYNHGFGIDPTATKLFARFYILLMNHQKKENLTRLVSLRNVAIKHFMDSIMVDQVTSLKFPLLDMGSGAGFPGIPLKIILGPEKKIILCEKAQRRVSFLKKVRQELDLKGLDIIGRNVQENFTYPVEGVITRAVEKTSDTLDHVMHCLKLGGCVYLMKGPNVKSEMEQALKLQGDYYKLEQYKNYSLPKTPHKRSLLVFKKIKHKTHGSSHGSYP